MTKTKYFMAIAAILVHPVTCFADIVASDVIVSGSPCDLNVGGKCYKLPNGCHDLRIDDKGASCGGIPIAEYAKDQKTINVTVNASVGKIENVTSAIVTGNVGQVTSDNGDVTVTGEIKGDASVSNGSITAGTIKGKATTGNGDVRCEQPR